MSTADREDKLWKEDGETAIRIIEWFDLFCKLRKLADVAPADAVVEQLRRADPRMLDQDFMDLVALAFERFSLEKADIDQIKKLDAVRPAFMSKFSDEQKKRIVARAKNENNAALAMEVGIAERTLARWKQTFT